MSQKAGGIYRYPYIYMYTNEICTYTYIYIHIHIHLYIYIYMLPHPQRSTKINAIRDILGYFHPHRSDHDDSDRWWTCEDMYISWFHADVSDGSVKQ